MLGNQARRRPTVRSDALRATPVERRDGGAALHRPPAQRLRELLVQGEARRQRHHPANRVGPVAAGSFAPGETVLDLLSRMPAPQPPLSPPCTIGAFLAFLEDPYVAATATDGWSRLSRYDAHDSRAVTLAPQ